MKEIYMLDTNAVVEMLRGNGRVIEKINMQGCEIVVSLK